LERVSSVAIVRAPDRHYADTGLVATVEPAPMDRPIVVLQTERALDRPTQVTTRHTVRYAVGMAQLSINAVATFVVVVVLGLAALTLLPQLAGYSTGYIWPALV
jgi:hypothetical protein